ncbi:histidine kinase [Nitrosopumilus sp. b1]|nr:histidine kinase [Nitrosopumilus sp. b1]
MFVMFLVFAVYGIITFDISIEEMKQLLSSRNEAFAFNIMQDLDQQIEKRISALQELTTINEIQVALIASNDKFKHLEEIKAANPQLNDSEITNSTLTPFMSEVIDRELTKELNRTKELYKDEYDFNVLQEISITNSYGANVALNSELSDDRKNDEDWWSIAKDKGVYHDNLKFREDLGNYMMTYAFRVEDSDKNFLGVMRVVVTIDDLLDSFVDEVELLKLPTRNVILLDDAGRVIYMDGIQKFENAQPVSYFDLISQGKDIGNFELGESNEDLRLISYAKSTGYKSFEGFDWVVVVDQQRSSFVDEFVDLRNSILLISVIGMIASVLIGFGISQLVTKPLKNLTNMAKSISQGNFDVRAKRSNVTELQIIGDSFNQMSESLQKLIETEKKLAEANAQVKNERFTAIGELAANVAHDLKNPLATVRSSAEILKRSRTEKDPELDKVIGRMDRAIARMSHQIEGVLNYVRTTPINMTSISIKSLIDSALETLEIPSNVSLTLPTKDDQIICDAKKMEIVFTNLILNAIQAIGKNTGTINIAIRSDDSFKTIEFQDSGPGVQEKIIDRIFEPLITTKEKGTGLGLSSCKNIVEQHGGSISVKNNPTAFSVKIPIQKKE